MEIRSAVAGAFATVAVAGLVFTAVAVSNAQEAAPVVDAPTVAVVGHYSTVESRDPIVYVPTPEPVVVAVPEGVVEAPAPAPAVAPAPAPPVIREDPPMPPTVPGEIPETPLCELPPEGYTGVLVDGRMPRADGQ